MLSSRFCIFENYDTYVYQLIAITGRNKIKNNIEKLSCSYPTEFVNQFKDTCKNLNIKQAEFIRKTMQQVIDEAEKENL